MVTIALIPARGNSKGIARKNIKLFNSKPLIYWSIQTALKSNFIDRVVVTTEDEEIANIARSYSAEVPFLRPEELSKDDSPGIDPVIHALEQMTDVQEVLLLQPTSPFRQTKHIEEIFGLRKKWNADSAVSISKSKKHFDLFFKMNSDYQIIPYTKDFKALPRQKYSDIFTLNGSLYLSSRESIFTHKSFFPPKTVGYLMSEEYSLDIDSKFDWEIAEYIMAKYLKNDQQK